MLQNYINKYHITDYLFPNQINPYRPMNPQSFRVLLRKAGFSKKEITPHGFRAMISTNSQGLSRKRKVLDFWWNYLRSVYP